MTSDTPEQTFLPANSEGDSSTTTEDQATDLPYQKLGDYKIIKKLGSGGMGDVYLGLQESLDRKVAIKTLRPDVCSNAEFVARFQREARSMAKLNHPNMVRCFSVGCEDETHYIAIEYVDGGSLRDVINRYGPLSLSNGLYVARRVADVLKHAHENDMIHRDIKPDNILVSLAGEVKVSDFGLVKAVDEDMELTRSGMGMGTPYYMPMEQINDVKRVDPRADIYALGRPCFTVSAADPRLSSRRWSI